ncbi:MAG: 6,7-dimethyl-8-ribityllumazine synthase [Prevotellaceae bacterium]|jgi:6,7-dimethyl-8-ribityllumazine synthase|nr:6,7-dimethyl-8-ribityllumazine synthase [Prevotellaceae bacterium]
MSSALHNLSRVHDGEVPSAKEMHFGIAVSEWNAEITGKLLTGAYNTLLKYEAKEKNIVVKWVPGSFELPLGAQLIAENHKVDAVICLGCVIQGETRHFEFICSAVSTGIMQLNLEYDLPFVFGLLTTNNMQQAQDRAGGKYGNKGDEAATSAIKMVAMQQGL